MVEVSRLFMTFIIHFTRTTHNKTNNKWFFFTARPKNYNQTVIFKYITLVILITLHLFTIYNSVPSLDVYPAKTSPAIYSLIIHTQCQRTQTLGIIWSSIKICKLRCMHCIRIPQTNRNENEFWFNSHIFTAWIWGKIHEMTNQTLIPINYSKHVINDICIFQLFVFHKLGGIVYSVIQQCCTNPKTGTPGWA